MKTLKQDQRDRQQCTQSWICIWLIVFGKEKHFALQAKHFSSITTQETYYANVVDVPL